MNGDSVFKLINLFNILLNLITLLINKYNESKVKEKYEEARNDPPSVWVDGFGVRRETKGDSSKTNTGE